MVRIGQIIALKKLGLTLDEMKGLLLVDPHATLTEAMIDKKLAVLTGKRDALNKQIAALVAIRGM